MCIFAITQFVRQLLETYRVTKQWQLNRYMTLLVRQGVLYFFAYVLISSSPLSFSLPSELAKSPTELIVTFRRSILLFALIDVLSFSAYFPTGGWQLILLPILQTVPIFTLTPRFILNIRELYARDVQGRRGGGIDTAFGLSLSGHEAGRTAMVFMDVEQNEGSEDVEEVGIVSVTVNRIVTN